MSKRFWYVLPFVSVLLFSGLWFYARPAYQQYREQQSVTQARQFLETGDLRNASLSASRALLANPRSVEACRVKALVAEKTRSPALLDWCERITQIEPTIENKLRVAAAGLRVQGPPYPLAVRLLQELAAAAEDIPAYHVMAAELALKLDRVEEARRHFQRAATLDPGNKLHQINLAVLGLGSTNEQAMSTARLELERLSTDARVGSLALRWLVADRLQRADLAAARQFSNRLLTHPRVVFEDRLRHLAVLQRADPTECDLFLAQTKAEAATNAVAGYALSAWMSSQGRAREALAWLTNLPSAIAVAQPMPLALVETYIALGDWAGLECYLQQRQWGESDCLRVAFLSQAAREQHQERAAETRWQSAVRAADGRLGALASLVSLAGHWGQEQAAQELLWRIARQFPREQWARQELGRRYLKAGNTRGLHQLYAFVATYSPEDFLAQNNVAALELLLRTNLSRAHETARALYNQHASEPAIASTYAYSLEVQGRTAEALDTFARLKPDALETPAIALYYGHVLAVAGQTSKAEPFLLLASKAALLPEENALLAASKVVVSAGGNSPVVRWSP